MLRLLAGLALSALIAIGHTALTGGLQGNVLDPGGKAIGGPIVKGKTYFFGNYERVDQERGSFYTGPNPNFLLGNLKDNLALAKVDHRFSGRHLVSTRLSGSRDRNSNPNDAVGGLAQPLAARFALGQTVSSQITDNTIWGGIVNEFRAGYINSLPSNTVPTASQVVVSRPGYSTEGYASHSTVRTEVFQFADQVSWQKGAHTIKAGADFIRRKIRDLAFDDFGTYTFPSGPPVAGVGPTLYTQRFGTARISYGQTQWAGFIQDTWRLMPRLTINLGLRYDYRSVLDDHNNLGPRAGFAWDVRGPAISAREMVAYSGRGALPRDFSQFLQYNLNAPSPFSRTQPGQIRTVAQADATRPMYIPSLGVSMYQGVAVRNVLQTTNGNTATYHALNVNLSRRFGSRYQVNFAYTYSSAINSITDDHLGANPNEWSDVQRAERAMSDFAQRNRFVANGLVNLPWKIQTAAYVVLASPLPVNALTGVDNNGDSINVDRPAGFGRNAFRGTPHRNFDVSVMRPFTLGERTRIELRADVFNIFNNQNYYSFNRVYGNGATPVATFRQPIAGVSNVDPACQFTFGAKLVL